MPAEGFERKRDPITSTFRRTPTSTLLGSKFAARKTGHLLTRVKPPMSVAVLSRRVSSRMSAPKA